MPKMDRWRKALAISVLVHCLLLAGAGWLGGSLLKAARLPDLIEVELISNPRRGEEKSVAAGPARPSVRETAAVARHEVVATVAAEAIAEAVADAGSGAPAALPAAGAPAGGSASPAAAGVAAAPKKIAAPRLLAKTEPAYPEEARRVGAEGMVTVRIEIKENGQPGEITITRSSGRPSFDAAAIEAVRTWRFVPAHEAETGRAVKCYSTVLLVFRLRN